MVDRIGKESAVAREAMRAAQRLVDERVASNRPAAAATEGAAPQPGTQVEFERALDAGIGAVDRQVHSAESLPADLMTGKVDDFHEIAVQLKSAELSFKFAMEIRNKLIDAYREIMRMSV
jgi:flagellar hook-basal body complex protein FliE